MEYTRIVLNKLFDRRNEVLHRKSSPNFDDVCAWTNGRLRDPLRAQLGHEDEVYIAINKTINEIFEQTPVDVRRDKLNHNLVYLNNIRNIDALQPYLRKLEVDLDSVYVSKVI